MELAISIELQNWNYKQTDDIIRNYMNNLGYEDVGSGAGFGVRNIEFEITKKLTRKEIKKIENDLTEALGFKATANQYEFLDELLSAQAEACSHPPKN